MGTIKQLEEQLDAANEVIEAMQIKIDVANAMAMQARNDAKQKGDIIDGYQEEIVHLKALIELWKK